ncbi:TetR/AcrR family transcriptional regulator, partial [Pseudomonas aeruginosa]|nr:TetR/AcrR family transcriptional regulator [Pseudomonas aeruginosa]
AQALGDSRFSPRERVLRYYGELLEHFARQEKPEYHCFIGSLSFEMAELSPPIAATVESILQASAQILQDCLEQAREAGELAADEDCASLAGFIGFAWQGALARFKVGAGLAPLNAFMSRLELLLRA